MTRQTAVSPTRLAVTLGYLLLMWALAGALAWPVYQHWTFALLAAVAALVGAGIAVVGLARGLGVWAVTGLTVAALLVLAPLLAVQGTLANPPSGLLRGLAEGATGVVTAWKELVTVTLPVGQFQNLRVPALVVFLAGPVLSGSIALRAKRLLPLATIPLAAMLAFGVAFGVTEQPAVTLWVWRVPVLTGAVAIAAFVLTLAWLPWRARQDAPRRVESGDPARTRGLRVRRALDAVGMVAAGLVVALAVGGLFVGDSRTVLRSAIEPESAKPKSVSPLTGFRAYFQDGHYDVAQFKVEGVEAGTRVRLAVMPEYDGTAFRVTTDYASHGFTALPWTVDGVTKTGTATVTIEDGYTDQWLPLVGSLSSIKFTGEDAYTLAGDFAYSSDLLAGFLPEGELERASYAVAYGAGPAQLDPESSSQGDLPSGHEVTKEEYPNLVGWVDTQDDSVSGLAKLQYLRDRIIQRSYLSHSRDDPDGTGWGQALPTKGFESSDAGHAKSRIEALFADMSDTEHFPDCTDTTPGSVNMDKGCAATTGDQEQYATAIALVARYLGYDSRVAMGATVPDGGTVTGKDITAWAEVEISDGTWVVLDAVPRTNNTFQPETTNVRYNEYQTEVPPESVQNEPDPQAQPDAGGQSAQDAADSSQSLAAIWAVLKAVLPWLGLLILLSAPLLAIVLAKASRRRSRRRAEPELAVTAGWDEYVDTVVDYGFPAPTTQTRQELAAEYATERGPALAQLADFAVFSEFPPTQAQAEQYWSLLDEEREGLKQRATRWQRIRARLSLASFTRYLGAHAGFGRFARRRTPQRRTHTERSARD